MNSKNLTYFCDMKNCSKRPREETAAVAPEYSGGAPPPRDGFPLPETIVFSEILVRLELESLCTLACVCRTLHSMVSQSLSTLPSLDFSAFSPNGELVHCIAPKLRAVKSVTVDCLQVDDCTIISILGPHLQELNLLKCKSLSYHVLPSIGKKCPNLRETQWPNKIRRLAVLKPMNFSPEMKKLKYLRSLLLLFEDGCMELDLIKELLHECRLLKVLDLAGTPLETIPAQIFKLYNLKYLCLSATKVSVIPKEIQYLENLETLDLEWCYVTELPDEILRLTKLRHLLVHNIKKPYDVMFDHTLSFKAPCEIGRCLSSLQSLCCIDADEEMVREIGKLTELRRLDIAKVRSRDGKELCSSIAKLTHLHSLKIMSAAEGENMELDHSLSEAGLPFLSSLCLSGCIERVPRWVAALHGLNDLTLVWSRLREDPLNSLQHLPNLASLWIHDAYVEGLITFKAEGFQKLKRLLITEFKCLQGVVVEEGSMPVLQELAVWDCKLLTDLPEGVQHLTKLQDVKFGNMSSEFVERFVEDEKCEGDGWRLAHVPYVHIGTVGNGFWKFNLHFHK